MSQIKDDTKKMKQNFRRPYQVPHLIIYGALRNLTAAGSAGNPEQNPGQGSSNKSRF
jgi:hypothetical protein